MNTENGLTIKENGTEVLGQVLLRESAYPIQNLDGIIQKLKDCLSEKRPFTIGSFVCLPSEWVFQNNKPVFRVNELVQTAVEKDSFIERTMEVLSALEETNLPFIWKFLIADTDINDVFGKFLVEDPNINLRVASFRQRIIDSLGSILPESTEVVLWSDLQKQYQSKYITDFNSIYKSNVADEDLKSRLTGRLGYYKKYYLNQGYRISDQRLEPLCIEVPRRNIALYGAQGPIIDQELDCLVISDREAQRFGRFHSLLVPNLRIWYPYKG